MAINLRRSKVDQEARGRRKLLVYGLVPATCPVTAAGRLSGQAVAAVVKRAALAAGLDPSFFAGHSLRAGHVTQAKRNDATDLEVMSQTDHRSAESISGYVREAGVSVRGTVSFRFARLLRRPPVQVGPLFDGREEHDARSRRPSPRIAAQPGWPRCQTINRPPEGAGLLDDGRGG